MLPGTDEETTLGASWEWDPMKANDAGDVSAERSVYGYSYDTMGRLTGMTNVQTVGNRW